MTPLLAHAGSPWQSSQTSGVAIRLLSHCLACLQVVLTEWPKSFANVKLGDVVSCPSSDGSGFAIVNNTIGNLRGRGILCKGSDGVIADNTLFNLPGMALQLTSEQEWGEADFVHNVLVSNNVINSNGSGIWLGSSPDINKQPLVYTK